MSTYEQITERYNRSGIRDEQLDGTNAPEGSVYLTRNYVSLGVITQEQANEIRSNKQASEIN